MPKTTTMPKYNLFNARKEFEEILSNRKKELEPILESASVAYYYGDNQSFLSDSEYDVLSKEVGLIDSIQELIKEFEGWVSFHGVNGELLTKSIEKWKVTAISTQNAEKQLIMKTWDKKEDEH